MTSASSSLAPLMLPLLLLLLQPRSIGIVVGWTEMREAWCGTCSAGSFIGLRNTERENASEYIPGSLRLCLAVRFWLRALSLVELRFVFTNSAGSPRSLALNSRAAMHLYILADVYRYPPGSRNSRAYVHVSSHNGTVFFFVLFFLSPYTSSTAALFFPHWVRLLAAVSHTILLREREREPAPPSRAPPSPSELPGACLARALYGLAPLGDFCFSPSV